MITRIDEDWKKYKTVHSGEDNTNIQRFKYKLEMYILPALKEINIDVDLSSVYTKNNGVVSYEAYCIGNLLTIEFQANNIELPDDEQLFAVIYTMGGYADVGGLNIDNIPEVQQRFLDALEEQGIDASVDQDEEDKKKKEELLKKMFYPVNDKNVNKKPTELPGKKPEGNIEVVDKEEPVNDNSVPLSEAFPKAVQELTNIRQLNARMYIMLRRVGTPSYIFMDVYYASVDKCLVQASQLGLDQMTTFEGLGKYLNELQGEYDVSTITVYDTDGENKYEIDVKESDN